MTSMPVPERRRISIIRVLVVALVAAALIGLGTRWAVARFADARAAANSTWFGPYVDVTLTPALHFEDPAEQPSPTVVLGFVVADPSDHCAPSWGGYYNLEGAARALDLDRRVVRLRERGGDATVSFGGALNHELATVCSDPDRLAAAYQSVIDRYRLTGIDFDIEGASLADAAANTRRSAAIARLQAANPHLAVWLTLPVAPDGLTAESVDLVDHALQAGVQLTGVNVMTMNYGGSRAPETSLRDATAAALNATWQQLDGAYRRAGAPRDQQSLWKMIGATPMIGQNDVVADVFTTDDAQALIEFAQRVGLGRLSFWSVNRDVRCGAAVTDRRVSNTCSGIDQDPLEFSRIFTGAAAKRSAASGASAQPTPATTQVDVAARDDPRTSPYPLWRSAKAYSEGAKVVWQGRVYQAKWWTQGNQPDAPVKHVWDTPWRYLGPVLESDRVAVRAGEGETVVDGTQPHWAAERVYVAGDQVEYEGQVFKAKWWTQGEAPQQDPDQPYDHPWQYVGKAKAATN